MLEMLPTAISSTRATSSKRRRSSDLLGIFKAGGAYVPLDPSYPEDRLTFMLADSAPVALLTQTKFANRFSASALPLALLDTNTAIPEQPSDNLDPTTLGLTPQHLAYVIYTSGSTGQPKGAMNEHAGVVNRLLWAQDEDRLTTEERVL